MPGVRAKRESSGGRMNGWRMTLVAYCIFSGLAGFALIGHERRPITLRDAIGIMMVDTALLVCVLRA